MNRTGIVRDERYLEHEMGEYHPETPRRLEVVYRMLDDGDMAGRFGEIPARTIEREELLRVHSSGFIDLLAATRGKASTYLDADTQTSAGSYDAALLAAGGLCEAVSAVHTGVVENAFALVRPPGHHAEHNRAMGFCLFNNVAVAAEYARASLGMNRILIVDWDLHHGNGTQHSFEADAGILFFSTHQYPYYPGTGSLAETGSGDGSGFTVNAPLPAGCGDYEYSAVFERILKPVALEFDPELILVSAGFDTFSEDPLGGMGVTAGGFARLTGILMEIARACCGGKLAFTLEGGYSLKGLRDSVKAVLNRMAAPEEEGGEGLRTDEGSGGEGSGGEGSGAASADTGIERLIGEMKKMHGRHWKSLQR